jgi:hypothetical protein
MRFLARLALICFFALSGIVLPQDKDSAPPAPQDQTQPAPGAEKDKKKKAKADDQFDTKVFSDAVARNVLDDLRDGLEGHNQRLLLSAFDSDKMDGYLGFEDQIEAFFNRYDGFRVNYRIVQTAVDGERGIALVDFELEETPRSASSTPARKSGEIRFELERGRKGWKIVDFRPRSFFS